MKRLVLVAAVTAVTFFVPAVVSVPASAAFRCDIGYTGPDSNNTCTSEETFTCEVTNTNNVTIRNSSNQDVASGNVTVDGNGNGGGAISGSASNSNNTSFSVEVKNNAPCVVRATVPAKEVPETPTPGRGEMVTPSNPTKPSALPVTSGSAALPITIGVSAVVIGAAIAVAHRRLV